MSRCAVSLPVCRAQKTGGGGGQLWDLTGVLMCVLFWWFAFLGMQSAVLLRVYECLPEDLHRQ